MNSQLPQASDVVWLEFPGVVKTKRRPAVILSSSDYHGSRNDIIVGLVTSQVAKATDPTDHQILDWQPAGLRVPSAFRAFVATVPMRSIIEKVGRLSEPDWREVRACMSRALA